MKERRKILDLNQADLAERSGIAQSQISKYEAGKVEPSAYTLAILAVVLETTADWILGLTDNPERLLRNEDDLDGDERQLISLYRHLDLESRGKLLDIAKVL